MYIGWCLSWNRLDLSLTVSGLFSKQDIVGGGAGDDSVSGNEDNDTVFGFDGDDVVNGGPGDVSSPG